jgi:hypothetical protein
MNEYHFMIAGSFVMFIIGETVADQVYIYLYIYIQFHIMKYNLTY